MEGTAAFDGFEIPVDLHHEPFFRLGFGFYTYCFLGFPLVLWFLVSWLAFAPQIPHPSRGSPWSCHSSLPLVLCFTMEGDVSGSSVSAHLCCISECVVPHLWFVNIHFPSAVCRSISLNMWRIKSQQKAFSRFQAMTSASVNYTSFPSRLHRNSVFHYKVRNFQNLSRRI